ncbi:hypothetical protein EVG20_g9354 [Dentipellis fragilis]|uniref:Uncharacterized protein n=1 Tax=Dentipellis fragilis TaxID=205917 RepID=A0A4Y9XZ19_9AGAM|nr:hypothetical protein EVG20_g9354 [Dentipellis fragilis]
MRVKDRIGDKGASLATLDGTVEEQDYGLSAGEQISELLLESSTRFAKQYYDAQFITYNTNNLLPTSTGNASSDPHGRHAVSKAEADSFYTGLPSKPTLIYRTGADKKRVPPIGPEVQSKTKEPRPVLSHAISKVWNDDLAWKVVEILDAHQIPFTSIDPVRFTAFDDFEDEVGPVVIWVGVHPGSGLVASTAHDASLVILTLLKEYEITDVHIHFRESNYIRDVGAPLYAPVSFLNPLADVLAPQTSAVGVGISTMAQPYAEGTLALFLAAGGDNQDILGLSCRHVLISATEANIDYIWPPNALPKDVLHLGRKAHDSVVHSIKLTIARYRIAAEGYREQIEDCKEKEKDINADAAETARAYWVEYERLLARAEKAMFDLSELLHRVILDRKDRGSRTIGSIVRSPAVRLGVGQQRFTEDWGLVKINSSRLGDGFKGNFMDLGTSMSPEEFTAKCMPHDDTGWEFEYPTDRLLPLAGTISQELMCFPDLHDRERQPCTTLVVQSGNATGVNLGRANTVLSIVRKYFPLDMTIHRTSMEWGIMNYDSGSEAFSEPSDSGAIVADLRGRIGGMLTGGAGKADALDMTYATPWWWLFERIKANGFPDAHVL